MRKTTMILSLLVAMAPCAFGQNAKVPDAVAVLQALESAPRVAVENADMVWNTGVYSYDEAGDITAIGSQYFVYDTLGRLKKAKVARDYVGADTVTQTYDHDIYGNLTQLAKEGGAVQSITVSAGTNRLTALGTGYDAAGNLTSWRVGTIDYEFKYDALGMPTTLKASNAPIRAYVYTADDERLFTYDNGSPAAESHWTLRDVDGSVLRDYRLLGTTWSVWRDYYYRDGRMLAAANASSELHYSLDHLGTPRLLTNAARQQVSFQSFLPFGEEITSTPLDNGAVKKFTGHERDSDPAGIGEPLDYMHARFYNGRVGRFLSVDPTWASADLGRPQSWNRYSYVLNNPVNYTDPDGRCPLVLDCVALGALGKAVFVVGTTLVVGAISETEVYGKPIGTHVSEFILRGGGSSGEMAAETMISNFQRQQAVKLDLNTPGTQATTGVNPTAPIQAQVVNTTQGPVTIPDDYTSRPADNGKGTVYQPPGASGNADAIRVMDPTTRYPDGYVRIYNKHGQPVNIDGKPLGPAETHLPIVKDPPEQKQ